MNQINLSAGTIDYTDTGGDGPVLVLLHGLMMDASLWHGTIAGLAGEQRCVARLAEVADSYALIPLDQPDRFASIVREFTGAGWRRAR